MTAPISNGPTTHGYTTMRDTTMRARLTGELPEGHIVKYGQVAPAFGQPGGAIQLQIWGPDLETGTIRELKLKEWETRGIIRYVKRD